MVLRNTSMHVETSEGIVQSKVRNARVRCDAECLGLSSFLSPHFPADGPNVHRNARLGTHRRSRTPARIRTYADQSESSYFLLRALSRGRLDRRVRSVHDGKVRGQTAAVAIAIPTIRLSTGHVLGNGQVRFHG